ncbi:MAG: ABC transporter permease [Flammeovirgaceae bacterium]|nr:ABC transporter permease [Flammeovirgaceae bacterium]
MILILLKKEITLELRRKSVISGLGLYLLSIVFIIYLTFSMGLNQITPLVWSALFWITVLFTSINTIAKSFIGEKKGKDIYLFSIVHPETVIVSKIIYNFLLSSLLALTGVLLFVLFIKNPLADFSLFIATIPLTAFGFSASLTMLSGIAAKANNSNILMAVLSFPIIISLLLLSIRITKNCIDGLERSASFDELVTLIAINALVSAVSFLLFPYIWRS